MLMGRQGWESLHLAIFDVPFKNVHPVELGITLPSCLLHLMLFISTELISCLSADTTVYSNPSIFFLIYQNNSSKILSQALSLNSKNLEYLILASY